MATQAFVLIETSVGKTKQVVQALTGMSQVVRVDAVTGPYDIIAVIEADKPRGHRRGRHQPSPYRVGHRADRQLPLGVHLNAPTQISMPAPSLALARSCLTGQPHILYGAFLRRP